MFSKTEKRYPCQHKNVPKSTLPFERFMNATCNSERMYSDLHFWLLAFFQILPRFAAGVFFFFRSLQFRFFSPLLFFAVIFGLALLFLFPFAKILCHVLFSSLPLVFISKKFEHHFNQECLRVILYFLFFLDILLSSFPLSSCALRYVNVFP